MKFLKKSGQKFKQYWMLNPMLRLLLFFYGKENGKVKKKYKVKELDGIEADGKGSDGDE